MPLISVISPTFQLIDARRRDTFMQAFSSLHDQTSNEFEHIVVDGASTDGTIDLINELIKNLPREAAAVSFLSEPDNGLYDAMNKGAAIAKGEYLMFLNSDDFLFGPDVLTSLSSIIKADGPSYVYGQQFTLDETGAMHLWKRMSPASIFNQMPFGYASIALNREMFLWLNGHDTRYHICADYDLMFRMIWNGYQGRQLKKPISVFRTGGISANIKKTRQEHMCVWRSRMNDIVDISDVDDDKILAWVQKGQIPLSLLWSAYLQPNTPQDMKNACMHAAIKTIRRTLNTKK